jgi:Mrp family chromosome partitioning ATPase
MEFVTLGGPALVDYVQMLWQRRWIVAVTLGAALLLAVLTGDGRPAPRYEAVVTLGIQPHVFTSDGIVPDEVPGVPPEEVEAARSAEAALETAHELGIRDGGESLLRRLLIRGDDDTRILQLTLTGEQPSISRELETYARTYADLRQEQFDERVQRFLDGIDARIAEIRSQLSKVTRRLKNEDSGDGVASSEVHAEFDALKELYAKFLALRQNTNLYAGSVREVRVLGGPILQPVQSVPAGALRLISISSAGLLLGCAMAVVMGLLRPLVGNPRRAQERLHLAVLAVLPRLRREALARDPLVLQRNRLGAEALRKLRIELDLVRGEEEKNRVILLASPQPGDGRSTVAMNLAASCAESGLHTALVQGDDSVRRGWKMSHGSMSSRAGRFDVVRYSDSPCAGSDSSVEPPTASDSRAAETVRTVRELNANHEVVVIDAPAFSRSANCLLLAGVADVCLLVARQSKTREDAVSELFQALTRHGLRPAGLVVIGAGASWRRHPVQRLTHADKARDDASPFSIDHDLRSSPPPASDAKKGKRDFASIGLVQWNKASF